MRHVIILSGAGRYADPWHAFSETSASLAAIAADAELDPEIATDVDGALGELRTGALPDLLIVNTGRETRSDDPAASAAMEGLERALQEVPILAVHASANSFADSPDWEGRVGGRWLPEISWHPELGDFAVNATADAGTVGDVPAGFVVTDERYLDLRTAPDNRVLFTHPHERGGTAPTLWVRAGTGPRTAYDSLGHDARSFDSTEHRRVLGAVMRWLLEDDRTVAEPS